MESCHYCHLAKDYFNENNIEYTEFDVLADADRRKEAQEKSGQMGVPVIIIGDEVVVGFDVERVEKALRG